VATPKISNDRRAMLRIANHLITAAGRLYVTQNGEPLTPAQEDGNDFAEDMMFFANETRERFGKEPLPLRNTAVGTQKKDDWT